MINLRAAGLHFFMFWEAHESQALAGDELEEGLPKLHGPAIPMYVMTLDKLDSRKHWSIFVTHTHVDLYKLMPEYRKYCVGIRNLQICMPFMKVMGYTFIVVQGT